MSIDLSVFSKQHFLFSGLKIYKTLMNLFFVLSFRVSDYIFLRELYFNEAVNEMRWSGVFPIDPNG